MEELKTKIRKTGRPFKDMAFALNMSYSKFIQIINGLYSSTPEGFKKDVEEIIKKWRVEDEE